MVSANVLQRVFRLKYGQSCGTCFSVDIDNREYIVTAKHVIEGFSGSGIVEIFHDNKWVPIAAQLVGAGAGEVDVAVLSLAQQLAPNWHLPLPADDKDIFFGQDVYFLGFPYHLFTDIGQNNRNFPIPFIKKAIVSSISKGQHTAQLYYLDGHNNPGFSGGPIVFTIPGSRDFRVAAVVSGYRFEQESIYAGEQQTPLSYRYNTGLILGYGVFHAVELIQANPIGLPMSYL